jgi:hypothetical protein
MVSSEWARIQPTGITMSEGASQARLISDLYMGPQILKMPTQKDAAVPKKEPFEFRDFSHTLRSPGGTPPHPQEMNQAESSESKQQSVSKSTHINSQQKDI